jgi:hypothetical protein
VESGKWKYFVRIPLYGTPYEKPPVIKLLSGYLSRYLAEFATGNDRKEAAENSLVAYKAASDIAMTELPPTHPIRSNSFVFLLACGLIHLPLQMKLFDSVPMLSI